MNLSAFATVLAVLAFCGVCWWVLNPKNKKRFEQDAEIVLNTDSPDLPEKKADVHKREI